MATTADYLNKLVAQKNALADNLIAKGVTATQDETLETLVPKVLDISGSGNTILSFKNENLLLNATPYTSSNIEILQTDSKVTITVPDGSSPQWFKLFDYIDFKINTFYKISVNTFGYGRIGISNTSYNPHNYHGSSTVVATNTNACVFSNAASKEDEISGDNYLIDNKCYSAIFIINLDYGSDTNNIQSGSIWFCNDVPFNEKYESFSFEISLQEQDKFIWNDSEIKSSFIGHITNSSCILDFNNPLVLSNASNSINKANQLLNDDNTEFIFSPENNNWEICLKLRFDSLKNNSALIGCAHANTYWFTPSIEYTNPTDGLWFGISTNGSSWTFGGTTGPIESGKDYWVKLSYSSVDGYKYYLSENGINFELKYENALTDVQYQNASYSIMQLFSVACSNSHLASTAVIDLNETYIKFGNKIVWGSDIR